MHIYAISSCALKQYSPWMHELLNHKEFFNSKQEYNLIPDLFERVKHLPAATKDISER